MLSNQPSPHVIKTIKLDTPEVIEGIAPIWVDGDGTTATKLHILKNEQQAYLPDSIHWI
ncbi:MAG: hypothetical protein HOH33_14730 [Verrucomicrobia bacterium]|jgi:hypothetical protein|nr:hypothetical protein [Verrucomicrobiota bacterium]